MKRTTSILVTLLLTLALLMGCAPKDKEPDNKDSNSPKAKVQKVALLLSGPANDQGWNAAAVDGLKVLADKYKLETTYQENVQVADMEASYNDYANQGYDLIIGHGFQFGEPAAKISANYADKYFMATESSSKTPNMSSFVMSCEQGAYLMGTLAAKMTKTKVIGVVGGVEQPSIVKEVQAFKKAAEKINPEITVLTAFVNSFTDVTAGQAAADSMIQQNADVLYHVANQAGTGVIKAAADKNLFCLGNSYDQSSIAPKHLLCSTVYKLPNVIVHAYTQLEEGTFGNEIVPLGIKEDVVDIAFNEELISTIGDDLVKEIKQLKEDIAAGKVEVPLIETMTP